jgi:hypothetical protein
VAASAQKGFLVEGKFFGTDDGVGVHRGDRGQGDFLDAADDLA